ncbi:MAG: P-type conjugative transfer ATPase TrbB [Desulfovibrionaceae bacterium]|nr:P-type conjugative transfer ATPase TrbB [Desulfovibrionaceae bacterium]
MNDTLSHERFLDSLRHNLGVVMLSALDDPDVIEILVNPDKTLWIESHAKGMECFGEVNPDQVRMVINHVAYALDKKVTPESPIVEGELPLYGLRFEGLVPPVVTSPTMSIRKKAARKLTLADYVAGKIMPASVKASLEAALATHKNILVVGGTSSGKTTLVNALIHSLSLLCPDDRLIIIEDTRELESASKNTVFLRSSEFVSMNDLLKATMRLRPKRILVGEVRGPEALSLLKSWNTGHPGGIATVHADSAQGGLTRLEQLILEATPAPMSKLIAEAVGLVVFVASTPRGRAIEEVIEVKGFDPCLHYRVEGIFPGGIK